MNHTFYLTLPSGADADGVIGRYRTTLNRQVILDGSYDWYVGLVDFVYPPSFSNKTSLFHIFCDLGASVPYGDRELMGYLGRVAPGKSENISYPLRKEEFFQLSLIPVKRNLRVLSDVEIHITDDSFNTVHFTSGSSAVTLVLQPEIPI